MAVEGLPVKVCWGALYLYAWRSRPPSLRALRHLWLAEQIHAVHLSFRSTYFSAGGGELQLGRRTRREGYHTLEC
ncbi:hypothetical protein AB0J77_25160 [Micromonospora tulbaghiae]|uniref:hypothetical protein n=1 Tax=Micromonospora tulbaghiae TaxID=479978 RepID=UPI0013C4F32B|nr:hypothetical protein [Micromonospora tulbaghiae]